MKRLGSISFVALCFVLLPQAAVAQGYDLIAWSSSVDFVQTDDGTGALSGLGTGGFPSGAYAAYPTSCDTNCLVESFSPDQTNYVFLDPISGGVSVDLPGSTGLIRSTELSLEVGNDQLIDQDTVDLATALGVILPLGSTIDTWTLSGASEGAGTPSFIRWRYKYVYLSADPFFDTGFVGFAPSSPDLIVMEIEEGGGDVFSAFGIAVVPEPDFSLMLMLGGLVLAARVGHRA